MARGLQSRAQGTRRVFRGEAARLLDRVQLKHAAVRFGPPLVRFSEVDDERDAAGSDYVVVAQEVAAAGVDVTGEVHLVGERTALGDVLDEGAELLAVDCGTEREKLRDVRGYLAVLVHLSEVASLVHLLKKRGAR